MNVLEGTGFFIITTSFDGLIKTRVVVVILKVTKLNKHALSNMYIIMIFACFSISYTKDY